jgi:hypothetical protein
MIEKFGKPVLRLSSLCFIKWQSHWSQKILVADLPRAARLGYWRSLVHYRTKVTKDWGKHSAMRVYRAVKQIGHGR